MNFQMNLSRFLSLLALCTIVLFSSCKKDDDDDTADRDNFVGTFATVEECDGFEDSYNIVISAGDENNELLISNIYDAGVSGTKATVDGDKMTIDNQAFFEYGGITQTVEGSGTITDNVLTFDFTLATTGYGDTECTAVCTKQ